MTRRTTGRSDLSHGRRTAVVTALTAACLLGSLTAGGSAVAAGGASAGGAAEHTAAATGDTARQTSERRSKADVLKRNRLYRLRTMRSVGCAPASQVPLDSSANLLSYYQSVLPCMDQAWKSSWKKLRKAGVKFRAPKIAVHSGTTSSPCGTPGALSFYCGSNKTIYMYDAEIVNPWNAYNTDYSHGLTRLAATHTLAHEYGHHLQQLVGILKAIGPRYKGKLERRAELQASCLGNVWLSAQRDAYPILADYAQRPELWRYITVSNHGSIANQAYWTDRAYASAKAGSCNTFKAPGSQVS
jgi:predicted metalloprotease